MTDALKVGPGTRINLHFRLSLDDGKEIDSTFDKGPASFVYGDGSLLPGVERKLLGLNAGETGSFEIAPEDAFGQPNPSNIQLCPWRIRFGCATGARFGAVVCRCQTAGITRCGQ